MAKKPTKDEVDVNWLDMTEGKPLATFKETNTHILQFKTNGVKQPIKITQADGTVKETEHVHFEVIDTMDGNLEKDFNITSKRLIDALKEHLPLIDKVLKIDRIGQGFSTKYTVANMAPKPQSKE